MSPQTSYIFTVSKLTNFWLLWDRYWYELVSIALQVAKNQYWGVVNTGRPLHSCGSNIGGRDPCNPCGVDAYATFTFCSRSFTVGIRNNLCTNILKHFSSHTAMLPTYRVKLGTSKITDIKWMLRLKCFAITLLAVYLYFNSALHPFGFAKSSTGFGWGKGGNVSSAGWQVTLCDSMLAYMACEVELHYQLVNRYTAFTSFYFTYFFKRDSVAEWLACWTQALKGPGSNSSRDAVW